MSRRACVLATHVYAACGGEFADREAWLNLASSTIRKHWYGEKLEAAQAGIKSK